MKNTTRYKILFITIFTLGFLITSNFSNLLSNTSITNNESINSKKNIDPILSDTSQMEWVVVPEFSSEFFSPDKSPGTGDSVTYSFSANMDENYSLNISAYYDTIDNYEGPEGFWINSASYLMPNGTWLIAAIDFNMASQVSNLRIGIGTNASNMKWRLLPFQINDTQQIAIAGDESNKIRIVYFEYSMNFTGIKCIYSDDWGNTWDRATLHNYTPWTQQTGIPIGPWGISIGAYKGNFTVVWSVSTDFSMDKRRLIEVEEINGVWTTAENLTAFSGENALSPQVIIDDDNGTLYVACDYRENMLATGYNSTIRRLGNGIDAKSTYNWTYETFSHGGYFRPLAYWAKDYQTNSYYLVDASNPLEPVGIVKLYWGQPINNTLYRDLFHSETMDAFNIYANNGPKCFSSQAESEKGYETLGILDCLANFTIRQYNGNLTAYQTKSIVFNGRDEEGQYRGAKAFAFNLRVGSTAEGKFDSILYVDNILSNVTYTNNSNYISPFTSPGINDEFKIDFESDKDGTVEFNIKSSIPINRTTRIYKNLETTQNPVLCGDGSTNYLIFIEEDSPQYSLMLSKSYDGGLSWDSPITIKTSTSVMTRPIAVTKGSNLFIWLLRDGQQYLYSSNDLGISFFEIPLSSPASQQVRAITEDLNGFYGAENISNPDEFVIEKSDDLGENWDTFCEINLTDASDYSLDNAA